MRENLQDLLYFVAIAKDRSFTKAAAKLNVSQSALSHAIRGLETRMGVRLLTRTTRSVAPTEAGEQLLKTIAPRFEEIEAEMRAVGELRDKPAGTIRITAIDFAIDKYIWPRVAPLLTEYPDLKVELIVDYGLSNIVTDRFDIGVRHGDQVEKDMVAARISPDVKMCIVGHPTYLKGRILPKTPQDLLSHNCITLRLTTSGGIYAWELKKGKREIQARVDGRATFNGVYQMINAALAGAGLAFVPLELVQQHVDAGGLVCVMEDWCPLFPGLHAYYPSRRASSRALNVVIDAIRHRN